MNHDEMGADDVVTANVGDDKVVFLNLFGNDAERYYFDDDQQVATGIEYLYLYGLTQQPNGAYFEQFDYQGETRTTYVVDYASLSGQAVVLTD